MYCNKIEAIRYLYVEYGVRISHGVRIYNYLSCNGEINVSRETLDEYIRWERGIDD